MIYTSYESIGFALGLRCRFPAQLRLRVQYPIKKIGRNSYSERWKNGRERARDTQQTDAPYSTIAIALLAIRIFMNMTMATLGKFVRKAGPRVMAV